LADKKLKRSHELLSNTPRRGEDGERDRFREKRKRKREEPNKR
jgi:hypothetical protein